MKVTVRQLEKTLEIKLVRVNYRICHVRLVTEALELNLLLNGLFKLSWLAPFLSRYTVLQTLLDAPGESRLSVLVLTPTRELAFQIREQFQAWIGTFF